MLLIYRVCLEKAPWFGVLLVMVTRIDVLCAFELIFSWRYQECKLVSRFK